MTIYRTLIGHEQSVHLVRDTPWTSHRRIADSSPAVAVARSLAMVALAAFGILVLLPAVVGAAA